MLRVEAAKNDVVLEHAALLLHSDPTAALAALEGYHGPGVARRVDPTVAHGPVHDDPPGAPRSEHAAQIAANALGRGTATYTLAPNIGDIAYLEWYSANTLLIRGTGNKLVEWQLGHEAPGQPLSLAAFSYSSTDARRRWFAYQGSDAVVRLRNLQTGSEMISNAWMGRPGLSWCPRRGATSPLPRAPARLVLLYFRGKSSKVRRIEVHPSAPSLIFDSKSSVSLSADGGRIAVATCRGRTVYLGCIRWRTTYGIYRDARSRGAARARGDLVAVGRFAVVQLASGALSLVTIADRGKVALNAVPNLGAGAPWLAVFSPRTRTTSRSAIPTVGSSRSVRQLENRSAISHWQLRPLACGWAILTWSDGPAKATSGSTTAHPARNVSPMSRDSVRSASLSRTRTRSRSRGSPDTFTSTAYRPVAE